MAKTFEVGQTLHVSTSGWLSRNSEPQLDKFEITRFNKTSVYAKPKEFPKHSETRFTIRTMTAKNGVGDIFTAYTDPEEYWSKIRRAKETKALKYELMEQVKQLKLEDLQQVQRFIQTLQKM